MSLNTAAEHLRVQLPDMGDGLAGAFVTLYNGPDAAACEMLAIRLQGAARHVMHLGELLRQDGHE
ncbi:hypothetical protein [Lysobacter sp. ESA13C]|uniref:hypothetical protein n=1 Tax=Lysobacter sp. ESA13C TaxID=2862676 RepID=UPI001CBC01F7|nr:hypothetical protein [Lysobacter sp. ESA13C]